MKILMLSYEFPPLGGGGSRVVRGLSAELVRLGHEVDLVTMHFRGLPRRETVEGVRVFRLPCVRRRTGLCTAPEMASYNLSALLALRGRRGLGYDLNHTHFLYPDGFVALLAKRRTGLPYVVTVHGSDVPGYNPDRFKLLHRVLAPLWRRIAREAENVICPSQNLRGLVRRHAPSARTTVIPNGFDVDRLHPGATRLKRVLIVSRLFQRKGVQYALQACDGLSPDYELHIVGDGPYDRELREVARGVGARVRFWGWLDNDSAQLKELYETSSIFVLPSTAENFPVVLLEAMAAGLAIVTIRGTGSAEVVGEAGVLVEPADPGALRRALQQLIASGDACRELGRAARRRLVGEFSWTAVARSYVELYESHALSRP